MPIQPYFPEPITVSDNVAAAKHRIRVNFVRKVVGWHFVSVAAIAGCVVFLPNFISTPWAGIGFLAMLVALTLARRAFDGGPVENMLSLTGLVPTVLLLSQFVSGLYRDRWPVASLVPVVVGVALYALLCGNDFSYIGMYVLTAAGSVAGVVAMHMLGILTTMEAWFGGVLALGYLFYFAYDLSMLVKRRRLGEEAAAVADIYRDLLNFSTYAVRVYLHWRRFRFI